MRRTFDIVVSLVVLLPLSPLMVLVALLIKLESKGSVTFRQERIGQYGQSFLIYKFRSMVVDAGTQGPHFTRDGDPRITWIGRFVRRASLNELLQLINVLRGEMSLVGPRPNVPKQRAEYTEEERRKRNAVRPAITGLAQATLLSAAMPKERTHLDLKYVYKISCVCDLLILVLAVRQVLFRGSH